MTEKRKAGHAAPLKKTAPQKTTIVFDEEKDEQAGKVTISLRVDRKLLDLIDKRWKNLSGLNRSTYFEILAQNDLKTGGAFTILEKKNNPSTSQDNS